MSVTVLVASIPGREQMLEEALTSVDQQTVLPEQVIVEIDYRRAGAAATRNRALASVETEWVAFLDDDDVLGSQHLEILLRYSDGADLVYPWFDLMRDGVIGNEPDPLAVSYDGRLLSPFGREFGAEQREHLLSHGNFIPITVLARTALVRGVGGFPQPGTAEWPHRACEDWGLWQRLLRAGAVFRHAPHRTWLWRQHEGGTAGIGR